jgi:hypothetical protein
MNTSLLFNDVPHNKLFSGLAFWLLKLLEPESNLAKPAAHHLGTAKSAAIGVMWRIFALLVK